MKYKEHDLIIVEINVDGILVGAANISSFKKLESFMYKEFKINMICLDNKDKNNPGKLYV